MSGQGLPLAIRLDVMFRSLLLQSCWSFERMQSLGFACCVQPWLRRCYREEPEEGRRALARHQEYFNTQPYMSPVIVGMVCALEEDAAKTPAAERSVKIARLKALKTALSCTLAAFGDAFFWDGLRPLCAALAAALLLAVSPRGWPSSLAWPLAAGLACYNIPVFVARWAGLGFGYRRAAVIAAALKELPLRQAIRAVRLTGLAAALAATGLLLRCAPAERRLFAVLALASFAGFKAIPVSSYRLYAGSCAAGVLAAAAGWL